MRVNTMKQCEITVLFCTQTRRRNPCLVTRGAFLDLLGCLCGCRPVSISGKSSNTSVMCVFKCITLGLVYIPEKYVYLTALFWVWPASLWYKRNAKLYRSLTDGAIVPVWPSCAFAASMCRAHVGMVVVFIAVKQAYSYSPTRLPSLA